MEKISFVSISEIKKIQASIKEPLVLSQVLADIFRINILSMIAEAGSGHIGTSFSSIDVITWLWTQEMENPNAGGDIYFSSKGHDVPAFYALLIGLGKIDENKLHQLRRLGGLPGHPDIVSVPQLATNTGSLGMGISKARGMAIANRLDNKKNKIYVLSGDGELQEGQFWESLQPATNGKFSEITLIVDHNKIQSDTWVKDVSDLGDLESKFKAFGWEVARHDGHDFAALEKTLKRFNSVTDRPQVLIADTIKGKGVTFMEDFDGGLYNYHSGALSIEDYNKALVELADKINKILAENKLDNLKFDKIDRPEKIVSQDPEKLIKAYGEELVKIGEDNKEVVVLDGDLILDCGLIPFSEKFPERFFENGIAEQDMVSVAGGLALQGKIPIVHSFACFLSTRPNEQIYNNATEKKKIIYAGSLAGLLPAGPGHSHQSVRDISILGSIPGLTLIQPANEIETKLALRWAVETNDLSTYIRLVTIPYELNFSLPQGYKLTKGQGVKINPGKDVIIFAYGPVMLSQALAAAKILEQDDIQLSIINLPWLNEVDKDWLEAVTKNHQVVFTLDDHYVRFGQGSLIASNLSKSVISLGLTEVPECGTHHEVLEHHQLDDKSIAQVIKQNIKSFK